MFLATTGNWFGGLDDVKKGVVAAIALVGVGIGIGAGLYSQLKIPDDVANNKAHIAAQDTTLSTLKHQMNQMLAQGNRRDQDINYLLDLNEWMSCSIQAQIENEPILHNCGTAPTYRRNATVPPTISPFGGILEYYQSGGE